MSSSFLDNPLLKVSRPVAACSRCRTAKIKCDGKLPACSACEKAGKASSCSGASDEFAKGKERSYVASLEGYCERLEKEIINLRRRKQQASANGAGIPQESSITAISSTDAVADSHNREVSDIDDLVGDFGFLSVLSWISMLLNPLLTCFSQVCQCHFAGFSWYHFIHFFRQSSVICCRSRITSKAFVTTNTCPS